MRHCRYICCIYEIDHNFHDIMASPELGQGESPRLNIASLAKADKDPNRILDLYLQDVLTMVKAILLEVKSSMPSLTGDQLVRHGLNRMRTSTGLGLV